MQRAGMTKFRKNGIESRILSGKIFCQTKTTTEVHLGGMYGNTGCGVFKGGIQNKKGFWLKISCI